MNRFSMFVLAGLSVIPLGCSGGGDGDGCSDLADAIFECTEEVDPYVLPMCRSLTCTGSKQDLIDYVIAHECNEAMPDDILVQMFAEGCTFPATCTGVAYYLKNVGDENVEEIVAECEATTCTGSKSAALECIVALNPLEGDDENDLQDCLAAEGCSTPGVEDE